MRKKLFGILVLSLLVLGLIGIGNASLTDGLVAYYPFNGNANDESGNGNNGIVYGATLTADRFGNANRAYAFDGSSSYIDCGNSNTLDVNNHTISAWVMINGSGNYVIVGKVNPFVSETIHLDITNNILNTYMQTENVYGGIFGSQFINTAQWYFVTMTYDGSNVKLYVNGLIDRMTSRNGATKKNSNNMAIGRHGGGDQKGGDYFFSGKINEVRIYNRALSDSEIQTLYHERSCYETGFVAGVAACKANPASCGINVNGGDAVTLTSDLKMHLPNIEYNVPFIGIMSMWADLVYDPTKTDAAYFKVTGAGAN
jgi:hypothetical protein